MNHSQNQKTSASEPGDRTAGTLPTPLSAHQAQTAPREHTDAASLPVETAHGRHGLVASRSNKTSSTQNEGMYLA